MSYFGRLGYNYKGKYAASATLRTDGSSRFAEETKFGTFWSVGGSWLMSDEAFITNKRTFSYLKLWATAGTSGNDQIGNYSYQQLYRFSNYANAPVGYPYQPGNDKLTWEKNLSYSFGLDFGLLNDRISGNINYYNRNTNGLIMENPISPTTGFTSRTENRGSMVNRGIELQVQAEIIHTQDFVWSVGANYTYNRNRVTDLGGKDTIPSIPAYLGYNVIGQPTDVYRMQKYAGIDPTTGAASWYAEDGSITTDYAQAGTFILDKKSADPKFFGGFNTSFTYKGISLGLDFSYVGGLWTYNNQWKDFNSASNYFQNLAVEASDFWTPTNTGAKNPALDVGDNIYDSDRWLQKGDMLRLRNVMIAYNIPNSAVKRLKMENIRVYVQGQNLWYYAPGYKGDPEVGVGSAESDLNRQGNISLFSYPQTKAITFGLSVTF
ncbi:TonB dependent receptor [compost metagenome]